MAGVLKSGKEVNTHPIIRKYNLKTFYERPRGR
jgi:hypothetical protein